MKMCKILKGPVAKLRAEFWILNTDIANRLAAFERKVLRRMFGAIKLNGNWRKRYNKELMQLFGDLDIFSFIRISILNWIGYVNRTDVKRK
jgi:hypothetical protein